MLLVGVRKKPKNQENQEKITEKTIKPIKILKKPIGSVRFSFGFISLYPKNRTEPNQKKTKPNQFEPVFVLKNRTEPNRTWSV
jgi:hypothetical protein